jgi:hypothetical protein
MKDVSKQEETKKNVSSLSGAGGSSMEGGIMPRMDLWKDFDDWYKSIFEDYSRIDQEMDRRFREFSEVINKNRERQIEEFRKEMERLNQQRAIKSGGESKTGASQQVAKRPEAGELSTVSHHSYTKERRQVETRALQIDKYRILYKMID